MQPYPWRTLYLEPPFCVRFGIIHLIAWFRWGSLFLVKIFARFWHGLGFGGSLFLFKILVKKYSKIDFSSFWHDLGFGGSLFLFKISIQKIFDLGFGGSFFLQKNCKKYKKDTSSKRSHTLGEPYT